jgi:hypothetical protein
MMEMLLLKVLLLAVSNKFQPNKLQHHHKSQTLKWLPNKWLHLLNLQVQKLGLPPASQFQIGLQICF